MPSENESNAGAWNQLELYARFLVTEQGKELCIVAGPQGIRGEGRNGFKNKIAVIMPNDRSVPQDNWWRYRVSVKEVEEMTGYTFFDQVPAHIITPLREEVDAEFIPVLA